MTNHTIGRWLLVAIAVLGLALFVPVVSAHDSAPATEDVPPYNGTADDWATWMDDHMIDHMGPGSVEWMEDYMGLTVDEMAEDMADGDYDNHSYGKYGQGHC